MPYSDLVDGCSWSPNYYSGRRNVTRLTPHHTAGVMDAWTIASIFKPTSRQASCNYAIGNDGSIVCIVDEADTAWTSSSWDNDSQAITFEISDCDYDWNIGDAAIESYINLCVDLIKRYPSLGGEYNYTGDTDGNVTFHRWFSATSCPGPHLGSDELQEYIQKEVNRRLNGGGGEDDDEVKPEDIIAIVNAVTLVGEPFNNKGMYYQAHVAYNGWQNPVRDGQIAGTTGEAKAIEAFQFNPPEDIGMKVSAHISNIGWEDYDIPVEGAVVGTTGESRQIEAIKIDANIPVKYRVHAAGIGWMPWVKNGEIAGTTGEARAIEAFQLILGGE